MKAFSESNTLSWINRIKYAVNASEKDSKEWGRLLNAIRTISSGGSGIGPDFGPLLMATAIHFMMTSNDPKPATRGEMILAADILSELVSGKLNREDLNTSSVG